jgi:hypothetical protein
MDKFEALYVINKSAKKYKNIKTKTNRQRKMALYNLKRRLINNWKKEFDKIEIHRIDGKDYFYLEKRDFGYHIPCDEIQIESTEVEDKKHIQNFHNSVVKNSNITERQALEYIKDETGYNVNNFIPQNADPNAKWGYLYDK